MMFGFFDRIWTKQKNPIIKSIDLDIMMYAFWQFIFFLVRRGGVIGAVRNCCFDTTYHEMLLTDMDLLTRLLLPLAGPTPDTFDETEMETLPIDLQVPYFVK